MANTEDAVALFPLVRDLLTLVPNCAIDGSTFLQLKRVGVWPPGALGKKSKHTDLDIVHLQSDTKNHSDLFRQFLKKRLHIHFGLS